MCLELSERSEIKSENQLYSDKYAEPRILTQHNIINYDKPGALSLVPSLVSSILILSLFTETFYLQPIQPQPILPWNLTSYRYR